MNERGRNESDISRYTDVEYSPEGYSMTAGKYDGVEHFLCRVGFFRA